MPPPLSLKIDDESYIDDSQVSASGEPSHITSVPIVIMANVSDDSIHHSKKKTSTIATTPKHPLRGAILSPSPSPLKKQRVDKEATLSPTPKKQTKLVSPLPRPPPL